MQIFDIETDVACTDPLVEDRPNHHQTAQVEVVTADVHSAADTETEVACTDPPVEDRPNDHQTLQVANDITVEELADGSVIINLPPSFTEGFVNIPDRSLGRDLGSSFVSGTYAVELSNDDNDSEWNGTSNPETEQQPSEDESDVSPPRSRKRQRREYTWKQAVRVKKRNSGQSYTNSKGEVVPGKIRPTQHVCCCKIDYECGSVSVAEQQGIFDSFWHSANFDLQNATLCSLIDERPVARRTVQSSNVSNASNAKKRYKNLSRSYHLFTSGGRKKVCKDLFLSTFGVSNGRLDRALKNRRANNGTIRTDQRGRHIKHQIPEQARELVVEHISLFPRYVSHYTRTHQHSREYLASHLNVKIMYRLYVEYCQEKSCQPVKESYYRHVFNSSFNLSFHQPLKDTCHKCDRFKVVLDTAPTPELQVQHEIHLRKAEKVRAKLSSAKTTASDSNLNFTFDLQKTLVTPSISAGVAYYKRQLATYNLGVHNLSNNDAVMYMWHEGCASRGASEIGSCLWKFVNEGIQQGATNITAFCDSCGGQNRNFKIATFMCHCVSSLPLESFTVHYMQSGHSFLPNDADFGVVEKAKKTGNDIYIPKHWMDLVRQARKQHPFTVVEMELGDFYDLSVTAKQLVNRKKASDGSAVTWLNIQWIYAL